MRRCTSAQSLSAAAFAKAMACPAPLEQATYINPHCRAPPTVPALQLSDLTFDVNSQPPWCALTEALLSALEPWMPRGLKLAAY